MTETDVISTTVGNWISIREVGHLPPKHVPVIVLDPTRFYTSYGNVVAIRDSYGIWRAIGKLNGTRLFERYDNPRQITPTHYKYFMVP